MIRRKISSGPIANGLVRLTAIVGSAIDLILMHENDSVTLTRDVEASIVPIGTKVTLQKGEQAYITQSLGGAYTVVVNGNMFRIDGKDADALGMEPAAKPVISAAASGGPISAEKL